eukprot:ANDGO_04232.mRNA.1 hypothetical protein
MVMLFRKAFSSALHALLLVCAASFALACSPNATGTFQITSTLLVPGTTFGDVAAFDDVRSLLYTSVREPNPGVSRFSTNGTVLELQTAAALGDTYGPPLSLAYVSSRDKLYALVSNGTASSTVQAYFLQLNPTTLAVELVANLNVSMTEDDLLYGGPRVDGFPIWFDNANNASLAYFRFRHRIMQGSLTKSIVLDLASFAFQNIHTFQVFSGNSYPFEDVAQIPDTFEAYVTSGRLSNVEPFTNSSIVRLYLANWTTSVSVFQFNESVIDSQTGQPVQTVGVEFVDPYQQIADFGSLVVNITNNSWFVPTTNVTDTCARASAGFDDVNFFLDYIPGGQVDSSRYFIHTFSSSAEVPNTDQVSGVVLSDTRALLFTWTTDQGTGYLYKVALSESEA